MAELSAVTLRQFRSYDESSFEFDEGVNIIIGPNAIGKTNLLEAIHLICFGKGFRVQSDAELVQDEKEWARVDASFGNATRTVKLEKASGTVRLKKSFELGGRNVSRLQFDDVYPVVLFEPDDLRMASGGPERRRKYIDLLLQKTVPNYRTELLAYERVLKQRNTLLKKGVASEEQLFVWNIQLADRGAKIAQRRSELVEKLQDVIDSTYRRVSGSDERLELSYASVLPLENYAQKLASRLQAETKSDFVRGYTSFGPHRDDIILKLNGKPFKQTASRGENRTLLLSLKSIELTLIEAAGRKPLLLLDDVFSELDGSRRTLLTQHLADHQTIITTTDADVVGKSFSQNARIIPLA